MYVWAEYITLNRSSCLCVTVKKGGPGKSREELTLEKKRELERRLQDVSGQLNSGKKPQKPKGEHHRHAELLLHM